MVSSVFSLTKIYNNTIAFEKKKNSQDPTDLSQVIFFSLIS